MYISHQKGEIPPRGVGLNKPARITIKNVVPKKGTDAARIEKRRKKLMEINAKESNTTLKCLAPPG
eukprot:1368895-Amorphochlora_amoeboformis.AAC.1